MGALRGESSIRLRPGIFARIAHGENGVSMMLKNKTVTLPPQCADAIESLMKGAPCRLDSMPGLDVHDASVVARRLIREGIAVTVAE